MSTALGAIEQKQDQKPLASSTHPARPTSEPDSPVQSEANAEQWLRHIGQLPPKIKRKLTRFFERFYPEDEANSAGNIASALRWIGEGLSRSGTLVKGERVYIEPASLGRALDAMPEKRSDLRNPDAAIVVLLLKLYSGPANLETNEAGETRTESVSRETRRLDSIRPDDPRAAEIISGLAQSLNGSARHDFTREQIERMERAEGDIAHDLRFASGYARKEVESEDQNAAGGVGNDPPADQ